LGLQEGTNVITRNGDTERRPVGWTVKDLSGPCIKPLAGFNDLFFLLGVNF